MNIETITQENGLFALWDIRYVNNDDSDTSRCMWKFYWNEIRHMKGLIWVIDSSDVFKNVLGRESQRTVCVRKNSDSAYLISNSTVS